MAAVGESVLSKPSELMEIVATTALGITFTDETAWAEVNREIRRVGYNRPPTFQNNQFLPPENADVFAYLDRGGGQRGRLEVSLHRRAAEHGLRPLHQGAVGGAAASDQADADATGRRDHGRRDGCGKRVNP